MYFMYFNSTLLNWEFSNDFCWELIGILHCDWEFCNLTNISVFGLNIHHRLASTCSFGFSPHARAHGENLHGCGQRAAEWRGVARGERRQRRRARRPCDATGQRSQCDHPGACHRGITMPLKLHHLPKRRRVLRCSQHSSRFYNTLKNSSKRLITTVQEKIKKHTWSSFCRKLPRWCFKLVYKLDSLANQFDASGYNDVSTCIHHTSP